MNMDATPNITPEARELADDAALTLETAQLYQIRDVVTFEAAADELREIKTKAKQLDELRLSITRPIDQAKKAIMDFFREPKRQLDEAESAIKAAMVAFDEAQEKERLEKEKRAQEAARAEQARIAKEAEAAKADGDKAKAAALQAQAQTIPAPVVPSRAVKAEGIQTREIWKCEVVDLLALLKGIIDGEIPRDAIGINQRLLDSQARALKEEFAWPGCKAVTSKTVAARAKKR